MTTRGPKLNVYKKMQLDVEVSPPANDSQTCNLQTRNFFYLAACSGQKRKLNGPGFVSAQGTLHILNFGLVTFCPV